VCDGHDSCTKETTYAVGPWLGDGDNFTIVDTPGFGDSDNDDNILIDEMMREVFNEIYKNLPTLKCHFSDLLVEASCITSIQLE